MEASVATLESSVGLNINIFDFLTRDSSESLRQKAVRGLSRVRCNSNTLKELAQNRDIEALEEAVSRLFTKR